MPQRISARNELAQTRRGSARSVSNRKASIFGMLTIAAAVLVLLALVSYHSADEVSADLGVGDLVKVFTGDPLVKAKADTARNWLGLVGAIISDFLINSTIGYSVIFLPFLLMIGGWAVLRKGDYRRTLTVINYTLVFAILLSGFFGMLRLILEGYVLQAEWSGVVGDFLAMALSQLLGKVGGSFLLVALLFITGVLAIDLDIRRSIERVKRMFLRTFDWLGRKTESWKESRALRQAQNALRTKENIAVPVTISKPSGEEAGSQPAKPFPERIPSPERVDSRRGDIEPLPLRRERDLHVHIEKKVVDTESSTVGENEDIVSVTEPEEIEYVFPSVDLLEAPRAGKENIDEHELRANADLLKDTLAQFDVELESVSVTPGPVVTLYELVPASGVKISRIVSLENDIALKLAAKGIRIMAPIPGKSAVGVEIPNHHPSIVTVRSVINSAKFRDSSARLPLAMGKTISGEVFTDDLARMPHLLMAGSTGSGKSVGINTILASLLFRMHPSDLKFVIIDPKKIELTQFSRLRNHFLAVSPDTSEDIITTPRNAVTALRCVEIEMEKRYDRLAAAGVRSIVDYNERLQSGRVKSSETIQHAHMPYLVVVIDELADLMITAAREVEEPIARLAQLARAVGIHLVLATQRPSVDVITGVIKANFPARIAYQVASKTDSRTILDMNGAEQLLGNGDMLYLASGSPKPIRLQNAFISTEEVDALMDHIGAQEGFSKPFMLPSVNEKKNKADAGGAGSRDELFEEAAHLIVRHQQGSVSLLQRRLKVGYSRAARLVDELEAAGIVGPFDGSKAREVLVESEDELEMILGG